MKRHFLLTCHDAGGTVPPMLALAESLVLAGHDVVILSQPSVRLRAEAAGCTFVSFSKIPNYRPRRVTRGATRPRRPRAHEQERGDDLVTYAKQHRVDVVVVDANLGGALAATERLGRPSAVLFHSMYKTFVDTWFGEVWPFLEQAVNKTRKSYRLATAYDWPSVFAAHDRLLAVVPAAFDAPVADVPAAMRHFGFLVPADDRLLRLPTFLGVPIRPSSSVSVPRTNTRKGYSQRSSTRWLTSRCGRSSQRPATWTSTHLRALRT